MWILLICFFLNMKVGLGMENYVIIYIENNVMKFVGFLILFLFEGINMY